MAYVNTTRAIASTGIVARVAALVAELRLAVTRRAVYRQTLTELSALTDRELNDLGLHRSSLRSVALDAAYGG